MDILRVAVTNEKTVILEKEKWGDGTNSFFLYETDTPWNPEKQKLSDFIKAEVNSGFSTEGTERELNQKFDQLSEGRELERFTLVDYFDVWGNEEDGYEVNDLAREEGFFLPKNYTNAQAIACLRGSGYLNNKATEKTVEVEDLPDLGIELVSSENGCPICRLEETPYKPKVAEKTRKGHSR